VRGMKKGKVQVVGKRGKENGVIVGDSGKLEGHEGGVFEVKEEGSEYCWNHRCCRGLTCKAAREVHV